MHQLVQIVFPFLALKYLFKLFQKISRSLKTEVKVLSWRSWEIYMQIEAKMQIPIRVIVTNRPLKRCWNQLFYWSQLLMQLSNCISQKHHRTRFHLCLKVHADPQVLLWAQISAADAKLTGRNWWAHTDRLQLISDLRKLWFRNQLCKMKTFDFGYMSP